MVVYQRFMQSIADIGHTILVIEPWDEPLPFTRAWCLWEIFSTHVTAARMSLTMNPEEQKRFEQGMGAFHSCKIAAR